MDAAEVDRYCYKVGKMYPRYGFGSFSRPPRSKRSPSLAAATAARASASRLVIEPRVIDMLQE